MNDTVSQADFHKHEIADERRHSEIKQEMTKLEGMVNTVKASLANNSKLIWLVFASLAAFELNAIFKLVGH